MSNLRLISENILTTSVSSYTVDDLFSSDFDVYKIVITGTQTSGSAATDVNARLVNSSGSVDSTSNYEYAFQRLLPNTNYQIDGKGTSQSGMLDLVYTAKDGGSSANNVIYVYNPYSSSSYTFFTQQSLVSEDSSMRGQKYISVQKKLQSNTGLNFYETNTRPFTGLKIRTYGLRVDS
tara:strand:- start:46 stop:579 length:534 start_codon:yes stop_codon:yes gene_type:complete